MSQVAGIMEAEDAVGKPVSDMMKDGNYSGPPMLFRHGSMQKIRHCCQNLNLFPYLLYSFDNSKSHPIARKVHLCFGQLLKVITARIFFLYKNLRQSVLRGFYAEDQYDSYVQPGEPGELAKPAFCSIKRQKPKENPFFLILAVYFAPLLLAFQLIGLSSLMIFGKYTPGFIFLIAALMFLGCISLKIMFHDPSAPQRAVNTVKCKKNKVQ